MKKLRKIMLIVICAAVLITGCIIAADKFMPGLIYAVSSRITTAGESAELNKTDRESISPENYSAAELYEKDNVEFNQSLMLINKENPLSSSFSADTQEYNDSGVIMNKAIVNAYAALSEDVSNRFGEKLYVMSAYRTAEEQATAIETEGARATAVGASEHQAGLALDVYIKYYAGMGFIDCDAGKYVNSDCWKYGFIIRYPYFGSEKTGISYEPWHIRYVGEPHAEIMYKNNLTLEEYVASLTIGQYYSYGGYIISRQSGNSFSLPAGYLSAVISPDNLGNYIITAKMK